MYIRNNYTGIIHYAFRVNENGIIVRNADSKKYFFVSKTLVDKTGTVVREDK